MFFCAVCLFLFQCTIAEVIYNYNNVNISYRFINQTVISKTLSHGDSFTAGLPHFIEELSIVDQNIPILYQNAITDIAMVKAIKIENCRLYELDQGAFKNISTVRGTISLRRNKLSIIRRNVFNSVNIETLDLSENLIKDFEYGAFSGMTSLSILTLAHNHLTKWNGNWIKGTSTDFVIDLKDNSINELPDNSFRSKAYLEIRLEHNNINRISMDAFQNIDILMLDLSHNSLEHFDVEPLKKVSQVWSLNLNNNALNCIDGDVKAVNWKFALQLLSNPLYCSCRRKLRDILQDRHMFLMTKDCKQD